jgi:hypothetical protein
MPFSGTAYGRRADRYSGRAESRRDSLRCDAPVGSRFAPFDRFGSTAQILTARLVNGAHELRVGIHVVSIAVLVSATRDRDRPLRRGGRVNWRVAQRQTWTRRTPTPRRAEISTAARSGSIPVAKSIGSSFRNSSGDSTSSSRALLSGPAIYGNPRVAVLLLSRSEA